MNYYDNISMPSYVGHTAAPSHMTPRRHGHIGPNQSRWRHGGSAVESLRHHFSVHDGDVDEQQQDDEEIIQEAQQAEERLRQDVQRRRQVGDGANEAEQDPDPEHPEEAAHREHLPEGVTEERGNVSESVHQLGGGAEERRGGGANINMHVSPHK